MFVSLFFSSFDLLPCSNRRKRERGKGHEVSQPPVVGSSRQFQHPIELHQLHFSPAGSNTGFTRATRPQDAGVIALFKYNPEEKAFLLAS